MKRGKLKGTIFYSTSIFSSLAFPEGAEFGGGAEEAPSLESVVGFVVEAFAVVEVVSLGGSAGFGFGLLRTGVTDVSKV